MLLLSQRTRKTAINRKDSHFCVLLRRYREAINIIRSPYKKGALSVQKYMVLVTFDHSDEAAFTATLPAEWANILRLKGLGILESVYISEDGVKGWTVLQGESLEDVEKTLQSFPLFPFMQTELVSLMSVLPTD
jgi:muconolactone delta-isomerase